jgi:hypothetical protein
MPDRPHEATPNAAFTARCGRDDMAPGTFPTPHVTGTQLGVVHVAQRLAGLLEHVGVARGSSPDSSR